MISHHKFHRGTTYHSNHSCDSPHDIIVVLLSYGFHQNLEGRGSQSRSRRWIWLEGRSFLSIVQYDVSSYYVQLIHHNFLIIIISYLFATISVSMHTSLAILQEGIKQLRTTTILRSRRKSKPHRSIEYRTATCFVYVYEHHHPGSSYIQVSDDI